MNEQKTGHESAVSGSVTPEKNSSIDAPYIETVPEPKKSAMREIWEFGKVIVLALLIAVPIRYFIAQPFIVRGQSMESSFEDGQYLIIDELTYRFHEPKRGEVVVFRYPNNPSEFFIKRIIGLPGEQVHIKNGTITIQTKDDKDFVLNESYLPSDLKTYPDRDFNLWEKQYVVLGDNRLHSSDSRVWGILDKRFITGRALFRAWPPAQFGFIPHPSY